MMVEFSTILQFIQATGIIVGVAYYILNIENNRRSQELARISQEHATETREAQLFMNIYNKLETRENSELTVVVLFEMSFETVDEFNEKYGRETNPEAYYDWMYLTNILEGIGVFVRKGLVDIGLVAGICSGLVIRYWEKYEMVWMNWRETYMDGLGLLLKLNIFTIR